MLEDRQGYVLANKSDEIILKDKPNVIEIDGVSMDYNFANAKLNSLKEYFIALAKRQLMFKSFRALDGVSFNVQSGDVFGIMGTNGSGKSTLLKIVSGVLEPTEGSVKIEGKIAPLIEMGAGFDFELTGRENIYLNGALLGYPKGFIDENYDEIVEFSEIGKFIDLPLKNYSSGMVSRLAFAIATIMVPDILIVDEVLSVGDQMFRRKCERRIQELIQDFGTTVLIVSHSSDEIERMCNKAIWIEKGHVRMIGEAKEVSLAYRALGGHAGSRESEKFIFDILEGAEGGKSDSVSYISANTYSDLSSIINNYTYSRDKDIDAVVVADTNDQRLLFLLTSFVSSLQGVVVLLKDGSFDSTAASFLSSAKPREVFLVRSERMGSSVIKDISTYCANPEIVELPLMKSEQFSKFLIDYREKHISPLGDTVVFSTGVPGSASSVLASHVYSNVLPVFAKDEPLDADVIAYFKDMGFSNVIYLDGTAESCDPSSIHLGEDVVASEMPIRVFPDRGDIGSARNVINWLTSDASDISLVFLSVIGDCTQALLAAPLAAQEEALVIPCAHESMDSIKMVCQYLFKFAPHVKSVKLIGLSGSFDGTDAEIFARALKVSELESEGELHAD